MIELTRLNGNKFSVNPDLIKYFEAAPDTTLTLVTGEKLLVVETCTAVAQRATEYRAEVLRNGVARCLVRTQRKVGDTKPALPRPTERASFLPARHAISPAPEKKRKD